MKYSQQSIELPVLHIIKNEEKIVDSNSLWIVGGQPGFVELQMFIFN